MLHATLSEHPVYRKALDIFDLSHRISVYLKQDLNQLNHFGNEDDLVYFSGDIVQYSFNLGPEILKAELKRNTHHKYKHFESLDRLTGKLYNNCNRLEKSKSDGRDFLPLLKSELRKFRRLQSHWMMTL